MEKVQRTGYFKLLFGVLTIISLVLCIMIYVTVTEHSKLKLEVIQRLKNTVDMIHRHLHGNNTMLSSNREFRNDLNNSEYVVFPRKVGQRNKRIKSEIGYLPKVRKIKHNLSIKENHRSYQNYLADADLFRRPRTTTFNCANLIKGNITEIKERLIHYISVSYLKRRHYSFQNVSTNCKKFIQDRNYITSSLTKEEEKFPIAYGIMVYKDAPQVERLLRAIYRPQNFYCIHIDAKSKHSFKTDIGNISSCFDNVFISSRSVNVTWGKFSNLEPIIICMKDLLKYKKWKYFIDLTGQEFPLRTNSEIVKILKIYNGANDVEGNIIETRQYSFRWRDAGKPPHGIRPRKGGVYIAVNRAFVEYVQNNQTAKDFLEWTKNTKHPDEVYFNSLNYNPQLAIPGSYNGVRDVKKRLSRFYIWSYENKPCYGKFVRQVCIFGVSDLPNLSERPELFANKFHLNSQPLALDCLEEILYNRTRDEYLQKYKFNSSFYENIEYIKHVVK